MNETAARRRPAWLLWLIWVGAFGLTGCPEDAPLPSDAPTPIGQLVSKQGRVRLERGGAVTPAELGYLFVGDVIETGADGEARIRFTGGKVIEVGPDARFRVEKDATGLLLNVERGLILSRVSGARAPANEQDLQLSIQTPFGLTRVGHTLSEVSIEVGKDAATLKVVVGTVQLLSRNGQPQDVSGGDVLTIDAAGIQLSRNAPVVLDTVQAVVFAAGGTSEIKKKGQTRWKVVPKKGEVLAAGDALRVKTGRTELKLDGSSTQFEFARGTEVVLANAGRATGLEQSALELKAGAVSARLAAGKKSQVLVGGLELSATNGGRFNLAKTKKGYALDVLTGDLTVKQGEVETPVRAGQLAVLEGGAPVVGESPQAEVTLPSRRGLRIFHTGVDEAGLSWSGELSDYYVEVASDAAFQNMVLEGVVHQPFVKVPVPGKGALHWRVLSADKTTPVDTGSAFFSPEPLVKDLSRPRNDVPEGTEKTTIFFQDKPPAVTFTYKSEPNAVQYKVVVYREEALDKPVVERLVSETSAPLEAGALTEGNYVWSVTPLSDKGEELRGGKMSKLEMVYDNAVPNLVIKSPKPNERVRGNRVDVAGVAPVGAKVFVNGRSVSLDEKARFSTSVSVGSPPVVVFRMAHAGGEVITVRTLRRTWSASV